MSSAKSSRKNNTAKSSGDRKRWCKGKVGRDHVYQIGLPKWARDWSKRDSICQPWVVAYGMRPWYCRHVLVCARCGKSVDLPSAQCPDRPEDDGTIEFYER